MSVSRGCEVIELEPNQWYVVVAIEEYDYEFNGGYEVYGPKPTREAAMLEMHRNASNPGSSTTTTYAELTDRERNLVANGYHMPFRS